MHSRLVSGGGEAITMNQAQNAEQTAFVLGFSNLIIRKVLMRKLYLYQGR